MALGKHTYPVVRVVGPLLALLVSVTGCEEPLPARRVTRENREELRDALQDTDEMLSTRAALARRYLARSAIGFEDEFAATLPVTVRQAALRQQRFERKLRNDTAMRARYQRTVRERFANATDRLEQAVEALKTEAP